MTTQQKIEELEKQQELLNKQLAELKAECNKEIELEGGNWFIDFEGHTEASCSYKEYRDFGAERKTKELAERARDEMRISNRLRARRDEIEPDWIDGGIGTKAWYISINENNTYNTSWYYYCRHIGTVYMSEQTAKQICEELNSGRFKL